LRRTLVRHFREGSQSSSWRELGGESLEQAVIMARSILIRTRPQPLVPAGTRNRRRPCSGRQTARRSPDFDHCRTRLQLCCKRILDRRLIETWPTAQHSGDRACPRPAPAGPAKRRIRCAEGPRARDTGGQSPRGRSASPVGSFADMIAAIDPANRADRRGTSDMIPSWLPPLTQMSDHIAVTPHAPKARDCLGDAASRPSNSSSFIL